MNERHTDVLDVVARDRLIKEQDRRNSALCRMAGNIAAGLVTLPSYRIPSKTADPDVIDKGWIADDAVDIARRIYQRIVEQ